MKKFYLFFFSIMMAAGIFAQDKKVMVVSANAPDADPIIKTFMNKIDSMDGIAATHVLLADAKGMTDFSMYDACVLTENGGSADMAFYTTVGWPLPVVNLKAYINHKGDHPIYTQASGVNWFTTAKSADLLSGVTELKVKDNSDILKCYEVDEIVTWTTGYNPEGSAGGMGAGEAHVQAMDLKDAVNDQAAIVSNSTALADNKNVLDDAAVIATLKTFLWKVEENSLTKRMVIWGIHHTFLDLATPDFYDIVKNSLRWVLKMDCVCPGSSAVKEVETRPYQMYPNPVVDQLNFSNAGIIASVELIDITGKIVATVNNDDNHLLINTSSFAKGMYFVRVSTTDGKVYSDKLAK
jgi:hypothetical protein